MEHTASKPSLAHLPNELLDSIGLLICSFDDVHALALTCQRFSKVFLPRLYELNSQKAHPHGGALGWAVCRDDLALAQRAIDTGAQLDMRFKPCRRLLSDDDLHWLAERETFGSSYYDWVTCNPYRLYYTPIHTVVKCVTTPLVQAVWRGNVAMARLLLSAGADVNRQPCKTRAPLAVAIERGRLPMVQLLVETGHIDWEKMHGHNCKALGLAAHYNSPEILEYLLPYIKDEDEDELYPITAEIRSALEVAIEHGRYGMVETLLAHPKMNPKWYLVQPLAMKQLKAFQMIWMHPSCKREINQGAHCNAIEIAAQHKLSDTVAFLKDDMRERFPALWQKRYFQKDKSHVEASELGDSEST